MARQKRFRKLKLAIYAFCEGKSEKAYIQYIKEHFQDKVVIYVHPKDGLFDTAIKAFNNNPKYRNQKEEIDEVWFFFDTEVEMRQKWQDYLKIIKNIRNMNKHKVRVRLLMTTSCLEYFLLLHYQKCAPRLELPTDKENILKEVQAFVPLYKKGDIASTHEIACNYHAAIENGKWTLKQIEKEIPTLEETDERNEKLFQCQLTFTTAHEALEFLEKL